MGIPFPHLVTMFKSLLTVAVMAASVFALDAEREDDVLVLGDENLAKYIKATENILVEFYAPWCGHCKSLAPEYAKAAAHFADNDDVELAKVDATEHPESASKYGVSGYPTIKFFKNGELMEYKGGRTGDEIIAWLNKKTGPAYVTIEDAKALEDLKEENDVVVVLAASDITEENKNAKNFIKFAASQDDAAFALTTDKSLVEVEGDDDKVVLFKAFDEKRADYDGKITKTKLGDFVEPHLLPLVTEFNDDTAPKVFGGKLKEHILFFRDADEDGDDEAMDAMRAVAKEHQGKLLFVAVDTNVASNSRIAEFFGLKDGSYPTVRIININSSPVKYVPNGKFEPTEEAFGAFVKAYLAGELSPALNSEELPEDWDEDDVKIIVGKNFVEQVLSEDKGVLLMAYAPWCGHCKSLMPTWTELAETFAENESVMIAKMDSTANEVEAFSAQSYPTLKFFPANGGDMIDYDGERDLESLTAFINKQLGVEEPEEAKADVEETHDEKDEL